VANDLAAMHFDRRGLLHPHERVGVEVAFNPSAVLDGDLLIQRHRYAVERRALTWLIAPIGLMMRPMSPATDTLSPWGYRHWRLLPGRFW
jgi:hypothetical protein